MNDSLAHRYDIDWDSDVFTLPQEVFDVDKPHVTVMYYIPPFKEESQGSYDVHGPDGTVTEGVSRERARRAAISCAEEHGCPIITPVEKC